MGRFLLPSGARLFSSAVFHSPQSCFSPCKPWSFSHSLSPLRSSSRPFATNSSHRAALSNDQKFSATMASAEVLPTAVDGLSLQTTAETSKFPNSFPSLNPVDIYREHIAQKLSDATGIEPEKIYPKLNWTSTLDKGDLVLPVCGGTIYLCPGWNCNADPRLLGPGVANQEEPPGTVQRTGGEVSRVRPHPPSHVRRCPSSVLFQARPVDPYRSLAHLEGQG